MELSMNTQFLIGIVIFLHAVVFIVLKLTKNPPMKLSGKHVVVTGGSSGIGLWCAIKCATLGADITIIARNQKNLTTAVELIKEHKIRNEQKIQFKSLDISTSYEAVNETLEELENSYGPIHMLINCAGRAICGTVAELPVSAAKEMMDLNYYGTYYACKYAAKKMRARGAGIIVITSSQAALLGIYGYGAYAASKFALRGLAETMHMELEHRGVTVTLAMPADTNTPGFEVEELTKPKVTKILSSGGGLASPQQVADKIVTDALNGSFISVYGVESTILTALCVGLAPWGNFFYYLLQSMVMGPLRVFSYAFRLYCQRVVRKYDEE